MYKVRYITTSEVTAVRYVFEEKEIEAADDADAIAKFDAECTTPLDSSIAMDIVSGEGYDFEVSGLVGPLIMLRSGGAEAVPALRLRPRLATAHFVRYALVWRRFIFN